MTREEVMTVEETYQLKTYRKLPIVVERGDGSWIWDADGKGYLDFYGGHCVTLLGHRHPEVVRAIKQQADKILFYSNLVYSETRARAARHLANLSPTGLDTVFFCNSGTEANETALKLAMKLTGRSRVLAFEGDFHGRTLGSLATTWGLSYREPYESILPKTTFVPLNDNTALTAAFEAGEPPAAVIMEPIQSMAGVKETSAEFMTALRTRCDQAGTVLIFDEVQTGVGRTGVFSVSEHYGLAPDVITLAKSLGSGLPVGAAIVSKKIAESVEYGDQGTTFGGGMLAMAAVVATLDVIEEENLMPRASEIFNMLQSSLSGMPVQIRGAGCLIGLEFSEPTSTLRAALRDNGVLVGGSDDANIMRLMPPLTTTDGEIDLFVDMLGASMRTVKSGEIRETVAGAKVGL